MDDSETLFWLLELYNSLRMEPSHPLRLLQIHKFDVLDRDMCMPVISATGGLKKEDGKIKVKPCLKKK